MFTLKYLRENYRLIEDSLKRRGASFDLEKLKKQLDDYSKKLVEIEELKSLRNKSSNFIASKVKSGEGVESLKVEIRNLSDSLKDKEEAFNLLEASITDVLENIPNILDERVVTGKDDSENEVVRQWGEVRTFDFSPLDHVDLAEKHAIIDFQKAGKITGSRFVYYRGKGAILLRALINFFLTENGKRGFEEHFVPNIVNGDSLRGTGQFPKFREEIFKLEGQDRYLIPTTEVPLVNYYRDEIIPEEALPIRIMGYSSCFRSEAGAAGKDTRGAFRNHQFEKVELVGINTPDQSDEEHHYLLETSERLLQELGLAYRVVRLCSGDVGFTAKMCYDIEVWIPSRGKYSEVASISNCGTFQAVRSKIRYKTKNGDNQLVHTLNGSSLAVGRTIIALLENYQNADGSIDIPPVLHPYTGFSKIV